jgi:hypothetical protein
MMNIFDTIAGLNMLEFNLGMVQIAEDHVCPGCLTWSDIGLITIVLI